jgi:hypothetical protein
VNRTRKYWVQVKIDDGTKTVCLTARQFLRSAKKSFARKTKKREVWSKVSIPGEMKLGSVVDITYPGAPVNDPEHIIPGTFRGVVYRLNGDVFCVEFDYGDLAQRTDYEGPRYERITFDAATGRDSAYDAHITKIEVIA